MHRAAFFCVFLFLQFACSDKDNEYQNLIKNHRRKIYQTFMSPSSPIKKNNQSYFKGLSYFPVNRSFKVNARLEKTEKLNVLKMEFSTSLKEDYLEYGSIFFTLNDTNFHLSAYCKKDFQDSILFIPFTDLTNGATTYEIGRYLDLKIPTEDKFELDFNLAYNPYCAYNDNYQCPIPPPENFLNTKIEAGEKKYEKSL